jgi:hypothetical protein
VCQSHTTHAFGVPQPEKPGKQKQKTGNMLLLLQKENK